MPDRMRGDLVAVAVKIVHVVDAPANLLGRAAETDAGIAATLMRAFIDVALAVGDEIDPADEEGEMDAVAVAVHLGGKVGEFLPALELGAVVECHDDELRRAIDARVHRHGVRQQQAAARQSVPARSFQPPTECEISDAILSDRGSALMGVRGIRLLRMQNLPPCDAKDTHGRRGSVIQTKLGSIAQRRSAVDDEAAIPHNPPDQYAMGAGMTDAC